MIIKSVNAAPRSAIPREFKWEEPNKQGNQNRESYLAHESALCGKCVRLGYSCFEALGKEQPDGDIIVSNEEGKEITLERSVDIFSNLVIDILDNKKSKKVELVAISKKGKKFQREKEKKKQGGNSSSSNNEVSLKQKEVVNPSESPLGVTTSKAIEQQIESLKIDQNKQDNDTLLLNQSTSDVNKTEPTVADTESTAIQQDPASTTTKNDTLTEDSPVAPIADTITAVEGDQVEESDVTSSAAGINQEKSASTSTKDNDLNSTEEADKVKENDAKLMQREMIEDNDTEKEEQDGLAKHDIEKEEKDDEKKSTHNNTEELKQDKVLIAATEKMIVKKSKLYHYIRNLIILLCSFQTMLTRNFTRLFGRRGQGFPSVKHQKLSGGGNVVSIHLMDKSEVGAYQGQ